MIEKIENKGLNSIEKRITRKISEIRKYEHDIPAVVAVINIQDLTVVHMSKRGREILEVTNKEFREMGKDFFPRFFYPDDSKILLPEVFELLKQKNNDEIVSIVKQVRKSPQHPWFFYLFSLKTIMNDDEGFPLLAFVTAHSVDACLDMAVKAQRLLEQNNYLRQNYHLFKLLTKREIEVIKLASKGLDNKAIGKALFISKETAATHRKNIKRKLKFKNNYDFTRFAQAFDLI